MKMRKKMLYGKRSVNKLLHPFVLISLVVGMVSCKKQAETVFIDSDPIPIAISDHSRIQTKATNSSFDPDDKIGLYVLEQPNTLEEVRHVDNACFQYDGGAWSSDKIFYYPSSTALCDFITYYPYRQNALPAEAASLVCEVLPDQGIPGNYMLSDFLLAEKVNVAPSVEPVPLVFKHKLAEINIVLLPGTAYDSAADLLAADPEVSVKDVATKISYNLQTGEFSSPSDKSDIRLAGSFVANGDKVTGMKAIIVPQTISKDHLLVEVRVGGKVYSFTFGADHTIEAATQETYTLTMRKTSVQGTITASIVDWENSSEVTGELIEGEGDSDDEEKKPPSPEEGYAFLIPDFTASSVYKGMNEGVQVVEICREYLHANGLNHQAVVVYPMQEGVVDLSAGFVAAVLEGHAGIPLPANVHGGSAVWNIQDNSLNYQSGNLAASTKLYINKEGKITTVAIPDAQWLSVTPDVIQDERDGNNYPIVKIASQYWMAENLKAVTLTDGTIIKNGTASATWKSEQEAITPGIMYTADENGTSTLYNYSAIASDYFAPEGWQLPTMQQWVDLRTYINEDVSVLKVTGWDDGSNLTGFSAIAYGSRSKTGTYQDVGKACFWQKEKKYSELASTLTTKSTGIVGCSVRCIRK